jgi:hypothetical protein
LRHLAGILWQAVAWNRRQIKNMRQQSGIGHDQTFNNIGIQNRPAKMRFIQSNQNIPSLPTAG